MIQKCIGKIGKWNIIMIPSVWLWTLNQDLKHTMKSWIMAKIYWVSLELSWRNQVHIEWSCEFSCLTFPYPLIITKRFINTFFFPLVFHSIIIYLIAFEVILALISHGYVPSPKGIWNLINGRGLNIETEEDSTHSAHSDFTENDQKLLSMIRRLLQRDASATSTASSSTRLV